MVRVALSDFIDEHRDELVNRCREKVGKRSTAPTDSEINHGVPLFLSQLCEELRHGPSKIHEIRAQGAIIEIHRRVKIESPTSERNAL